MSVAANPDFRKLWAAQAVSGFGARITREGLPMMAVMVLAASPGQLGVLAALSTAPALVVGLAAGGFVDRTRRRGVLIAADLVRAAVLLTLPVAAVLGVLNIWFVYGAAALVAGASVLFDIADHAYLPGLIQRDQLTDGNARLSATESVAEIAGPALAGLLFQWLTAPFAVAVNAVTYAISAVFLGAIRKPEPDPDRSAPQANWRQDVSAGFRIAWLEPHVRPLLLMSAASALFGAFFSALYVVFALRVLHLTPALLGFTIAAGGVGALAGAMLAQPIARRVGVGPAIALTLAGSAVSALLIPLAPANPVFGTAFLVAAQLLGDALATASLILAASLRQSILPQAALGRVGGAFHAAGGGMAALGALAGGALGGAFGPREALLAAVSGLILVPLIGLFSPLRHVREMPAGDGEQGT
jgi:Na+/melibiose symporter-like transporter